MRFSCIISTSNRAKILANAIRSIINQTHQVFEIIVTDDASVDNTAEIVAGFGDKRINYLKASQKKGLSFIRNAALRASRGDYVVLMDDDIVLKSNFLQVSHELLVSNNANILCPVILNQDTQEPFLKNNPIPEKKNLGLFDFNYFLGGCHVFKKDLLNKVGYFDERFGIGARYRASEESDYFFRLKRAGENVLYCKSLLAYHASGSHPSAEKVFNYSYGISAMLTKQLLTDPARFYAYLWILVKRIIVSIIRAAQYAVFPKSIEEKNSIYKYKYFFKGSLAGIFGYLKYR